MLSVSVNWVIVVFVLSFLSSFVSTRSTNNATKVLQDLLDPNFYDKRLRPHFEGKPVDVAVTVHMTSIGGLDEKEMQFESTFFLRQDWIDDRLAYKDKYKEKDNMTLGGEIMKQIWRPDLYINNEKSSLAPESQFLLKIFPNGKVLYSQRMSVTASCMMYLRNFPMDKQTCSLLFESYGMTMADLVLNWRDNPYKNSASLAKGMSMSQFEIEDYTANKTIATYVSGSFSILKLSFQLRRKKFYYVIQTYIPTILITILSWVSFWIPRSSPPARVALGITTVLALTTLIFGIQSSMPKVSYVKAIDWFLMVSFTYVFAALIEYPSSTFIKFQATKLGRSGKTILRKVKGEPNHVTASDVAMTNFAMSNPVKEPGDEKNFSRPSLFGGTKQARAHDYENGELRLRKPQEGKKQNKHNENFTDGESLNVVDKYSRICFPLTYFLYNLAYWIVYLFEIDVITSSS